MNAKLLNGLFSLLLVALILYVGLNESVIGVVLVILLAAIKDVAYIKRDYITDKLAQP